jgi:hypothetical protein
VTEVSTYEKEFDRFAAWCGSSKDCALHGKDVAAEFDNLVKQADKTPIPALACDGTTCRNDVTGEEIRFNAQPYLIFKSLTWPILGEALAQALEGNATILSTALAVAGQAEANTALFGERAVVCLDWLHSSSNVSDILYKQELTAAIASHTQGASQFFDAQVSCIGKIPSCIVLRATVWDEHRDLRAIKGLRLLRLLCLKMVSSMGPRLQHTFPAVRPVEIETLTNYTQLFLGWPAPVNNPPREAHIEGAPPMLMVNALYDPETSYTGAVDLREQIPGAVLLTRNGDGHVSRSTGKRVTQTCARHVQFYIDLSRPLLPVQILVTDNG